MSSSWLIAVEMFIVLGLVLGLAVYELWSLRRDRSRREKNPENKIKGSDTNDDPPA
jgi:hypothetical protein